MPTALDHEAMHLEFKRPNTLVASTTDRLASRRRSQTAQGHTSFGKDWAEGEYAFDFKAGDEIYRYWDATACVEFGLRMAAQALDVELRQETRFLARYDRVVRTVSARVDVRGSDLATLAVVCLDREGVISQKMRKRFADRVATKTFDLIETVAREALESAIEGE